MNNEFPVCPKGMDICFAAQNVFDYTERKDVTYCSALRNTKFEGDCPFFKTKEYQAMEDRDTKERAKSFGYYGRSACFNYAPMFENEKEWLTAVRGYLTNDVWNL